MRVLIANTYHYLRGGDCTYSFGLANLLKSNGHEVVHFAMQHEHNLDSEYSSYFVSNIDYSCALNNVGLLSASRVASRSIYSLEARQNIRSLIKATNPHIAHFQSIHHHLTPSIIYPLREANIPIIWTLHDFKLICPNSHFMCAGLICEQCKKTKYYNAVLKRCKKGSRASSLMACAESYIHRLLKIENSIDQFIAPSQFLRSKLIEYGINKERITYLPNFVSRQEPKAKVQRHKIVYAGRLSHEKGIDTLIRAVAGIKDANLMIIGDGPLRDELEYLAKSIAGRRVTFLGHRSHEEVQALISDASCIVIPSTCYENCPYSILEAYALGIPVIGSRIGGIPELVDDGVSGFLFQPGDEFDLRAKIQKLITNSERLSRMSESALQKIEIGFTPEYHYSRIIELYNHLKRN